MQRRAYQRARRAVRPLVKPGAPLAAVSPYPGHRSLVRSVVEGLRANGADFNFNPTSFSELGRVVYAPANEALLQAAELKRHGKIAYLVAGPVNALLPSQSQGILRLPEIDRLIVPSEWVVELYRLEAPELLSKVRVCQCGVDVKYWQPSSERNADRVLVYWKNGSEPFCETVEQVVVRLGFAPVRVRYGSYDAESYRRILQDVAAGVFLSSFETQGLALAEAWAMDVPTIAWNPCGRAEWMGDWFQAGSSCPFLTASTGRSWRTIEELETVLADALRKRQDFRPRQWVLSNMTDAGCSAALYQIIEKDSSGIGQCD